MSKETFEFPAVTVCNLNPRPYKSIYELTDPERQILFATLANAGYQRQLADALGNNWWDNVDAAIKESQTPAEYLSGVFQMEYNEWGREAYVIHFHIQSQRALSRPCAWWAPATKRRCSGTCFQMRRPHNA